MKTWKQVTGPMRVPFLLLAPACAFPGVALAIHETGRVDGLSIALILLAAVAGHVSVNAFNEVDDFVSGLDERTHRTPFSGGSGTLQERPDLLSTARGIAWTSLLTAAGIGAWFVWQRGPVVAGIGVVGVVMVLGYSRWFVRSPFLCLIAPGVGFGTVLTLGAYAALTGVTSPAAVLVSMVPLLLVSNLLLLNQFPDVEADRTVGRRHLPILWGRGGAAWLYAAIHLLANLTLGVGLMMNLLPVYAALGFLTVPLAVRSSVIAIGKPDDLEGLLPAMGQNVLVNLLTPVLIGIGLLIG